MKKCILVIFLFICSVQTYAQKNIHVGLNLINALDITQIKDEDNNFVSQLMYRPGFEFRIGHDITSLLSIETGFISLEYKLDFGYLNIPRPSTTDKSFTTIQIPIRLRARWQILNESVIISPILGYRIIHASGGSFSRFGISGGATLEHYTERTKSAFTSLAELGTDLEFKILKRLYITTGISYVKGFKNITKTTGLYYDGEVTVHNFSTTTKASYLGLNIGFRYSFNPYWIKPALQEVYEKSPQ